MFIIYRTHAGRNARYVIKRATDSAPCKCIWEIFETHETLYSAIERKRELEQNAEKG